MFGTILYQEMLLGGRRNSVHVLRWVYGGWLVLQTLWLSFLFGGGMLVLSLRRAFTPRGLTVATPSAPEIIGGEFVELFLRQQSLLLFLITPAVVGSALVEEKRQGTLQYLLLTEVEPRHIVFGKMLGRVCQVLLIGLAGLPLFAYMAGFAGMAPVSWPFFIASVMLPVLGVTALTLFVSVFCRQTRDAVLAVYVILLVGWLLQRLISRDTAPFDPLWIYEPARGPLGSLDLAQALGRLGAGAAAWGGVMVLALGLTGALLRRVYLGTLEKSRKPSRWYRTDAAPVDDHPIRWRELNFEGLSPLPFLRRVPRAAAIAIVALATTISSLAIVYYSLRGGTVSDLLRALLQMNVRRVSELLPEASGWFFVQSIAVLLLASFVVGSRCAGAITSEKEHGSWEALMLTPISAKQVVYGKLWAVMGATYAYLLAYAGPALSLSVLGGLSSLLSTLLWLAVTVLAMYFIGAAGIRCSAHSKTSWGSLLKTLSLGYLGGLVISVLCSPVFFVLAMVFLIVLALIDVVFKTDLMRTYGVFAGSGRFIQVFWVGTALGLAILFWLLARWFLAGAHRRVADVERDLDDDPFHRASRRPEEGRSYR